MKSIENILSVLGLAVRLNSLGSTLVAWLVAIYKFKLSLAN
jgi:hypothetical protein